MWLLSRVTVATPCEMCLWHISARRETRSPFLPSKKAILTDGLFAWQGQ